MTTVLIFNPLHVLGNRVSHIDDMYISPMPVSDIDGVVDIQVVNEHPEICPQIEVMKTEVRKYQALVASIKSFDEWKHSKEQDTFDLSDWWKSNCATLPAFTYVLRAVLTNSPNSCPPENPFSIFNATHNDDQKSSHTDYIQSSMQSQFNKRAI